MAQHDNKNVFDGLHNRQDFFDNCADLLKKSADNMQLCIVSIDIEKFKLFNEWYGWESGNRLLNSISDCLINFQNHKISIAGHFGDDDFAFFMEHDEDKIKKLCAAVNAQIKLHCHKMNMLPSFGIYPISDKTGSVYQMYDRAKLACDAVTGNYTSRIKWFDPEMLEALESELLLLADIQTAFENNEFTFFLQPKCNMINGKIVGAEALARWNSAEKGYISPGVFIPFLEKSGLVSELDTFLWEEVCRWQRSMLDRGLETVPVSVNISRIDICAIDVPAYFKHLIKKYKLDPKLIELEITESAYAEDISAVNEIVTQLHDEGFRILMDDFGSAYSSLNMLKDLTLDVIKMDMRFLHWNENNTDKAFSILETVCNMSQLLGMDIIAEGVETEEQKKLLLKTGCTCGQGYYFYRPLSIADFEKTIADPEILDRNYLQPKQDELLYLRDLLNKNILSQDMLSNMLGAVAFYDIHDGHISVHRYNEQYAAIFGDSGDVVETELNFGEQLYQKDSSRILQMFDNAQKNRHTGASIDIHRRKSDGTDIWFYLRAFFLYQRDGHSYFYCTVRDVTEIHHSNAILHFLNNDLPGGYYRHKNNPDGDFTHISQRFLDIFGYSREEIQELFDDKFVNMIHPDDRHMVRYGMSSMKQTGGNYSLRCRMLSKNGYISLLDQSRLVHFDNQEIFQGLILCDLDDFM